MFRLRLISKKHGQIDSPIIRPDNPSHSDSDISIINAIHRTGCAMMRYTPDIVGYSCEKALVGTHQHGISQRMLAEYKQDIQNTPLEEHRRLASEYYACIRKDRKPSLDTDVVITI